MLTFVLTGDHRIAESVRNLTATQSYSYPFGNRPKGSLEAGKTSEWMYVNQTALVNFSGSDNKITRKVPLVTNNTIQGCTLTYGIRGDLRRDSKDSIYVAVSGSKGFDKWADSLFCITTKRTITINDTLRGYMPYQPHRIYPIEHKEQLLTRNVGFKQYELTDHLGNVRVVVGDVKAEGTLLQDAARILAYNNFYAFGMTMPGRTFNSNVYRYGFNGKEKDGEWNSGGAIYDYGFRIYDPRIAKFLSVDPLTMEYPSWSPYPFAMNRPIDGIDLDGLEWYKDIADGFEMWGNELKDIGVGIKNSVKGEVKEIIESPKDYVVKRAEEIKDNTRQAGALASNIPVALYNGYSYGAGSDSKISYTRYDRKTDQFYEDNNKWYNPTEEEGNSFGATLDLMTNLAGMKMPTQASLSMGAQYLQAFAKRRAAYLLHSPNWSTASLKETLKKFADGITGVPSADGVKTNYYNPATNIEVKFDNENNYFRIYDYNKKQYLDMDGKVPSTGKLQGDAAKDYVKANSHFKNAD